MTFDFVDLRSRPDFFDITADRIWRAWWEPTGVPLAYIASRLREAVSADAVPFALVAHAGGTFAGTAGVAVSELEDRPQYSPSIAAVWVEPAFRSHRLGQQLILRAAQTAFAAGHERV